MVGRYRLGVDIGGTFTDVMVADDAGAVAAILKTPSVPGAPEEAIFNALDELRGAGEPPEEIALFVHGTTLGVNTLIERSGARTGLLVTRGLRDILEIRRLRLENTTDFYGDKPLPLVPRDLVAEIDERMLADGRVHRALDLAQTRDAIRRLQADGVRRWRCASCTPTKIRARAPGPGLDPSRISRALRVRERGPVAAAAGV